MRPDEGCAPLIQVLDPDPYTSSLLMERFSRLEARTCLRSDPESVQAEAPAILVLNHHASEPPPAPFLAALKARAPGTHVAALVSPGSGARTMERLRRQGLVDALFEKPLDLEALAHHLAGLLEEARSRARQASEYLNLLRFLPTGSLRRAFSDPEPGQAELLDLAILFTDIRDSSRWIAETPAREYFARLNRVLGEQARLIRAYEGMVVKTTGDGLLAVFEGVARRRLALQCAQAIQAGSRGGGIPVGVGLSDGLVLTGILGTPEHMHLDVIGIAVHVASRLCALAGPGEILATRSLAGSSPPIPASPTEELVTIRGFPTPVACARFPAPSEEQTWTSNSPIAS